MSQNPVPTAVPTAESSVVPVVPNREPQAAPETPVAAAQQSATRLSQLLGGLSDQVTEEPDSGIRSDAPAPRSRASDRRFENQLAMVRLGMATSLFYALRAKHAPTAAHSLRVALVCSAWCDRLGLSEEDRDRIEVAALLHDIGTIGIPDRILRKPARLSMEEQLTIDCRAQLGCEILRGCTQDNLLLAVVEHSNCWFDSRRQEDSLRGDALPLGARMLLIAGAFDAMTTDQIYRPALSRERALGELLQGAGTQFDPQLVQNYAAMLEQEPELLHGNVVHRWLRTLECHSGNLFGSAAPVNHATLPEAQVTPAEQNPSVDAMPGGLAAYYETLGRQLRDGIVFIDREGQILMWNEAMSRLTGVASAAVVNHAWDPESVGLLTSNDAETCPVTEAIKRRVLVTRSMKLIHENKSRDVFVQAAPINAPASGAILILRDMSDRAQLQNQVQSLQQKVTRDPLTGVANRAELDRTLLNASTRAAAQGETFALVICDIDHFKRVNDVHGHPAGDEALIEFAAILNSHARDTDVVARYGGEEFVLLATKTDNATATRRAEEIRRALETTPLNGLGGNSVTASFGVTEYQAGDDAETVLARADRALLQAKQNGRNRVVQLGSGHSAIEANPSGGSWLNWFTGGSSAKEHRFQLITPVPTDLAIMKLRGFIADHRAEIINVTDTEISLRTDVRCGTGRRAADHRMTLQLNIKITEVAASPGENRRGGVTSTGLDVLVQPTRNRDRRSRDLEPCLHQILGSLKSYLMAEMIADA
ncbi:MAG: diguanylate cyclase [Planctomycetota bacterium]